VTHDDVPHRTVAAGTMGQIRGWFSGAFFGLVVASLAYVLLADPGAAGRRVWLEDPVGVNTAIGLLSPGSTPQKSGVSAPVRLSITAIGVDTPLESLELRSDGTLAAPREWNRAGWYAAGVRPGAPGPAVIAGHVDSTTGPAVFFKLRLLRVGDLVTVRRTDGSTAKFVVDNVHAYPKAQFPTSDVYGPTPVPELRLVTCTGDFDAGAGSYLDNLVVSAHLQN
jgi:hypothetical protein